MRPLDHALDRTVIVRAPRATVFGYFTDSARWARWWGEGSTIDPRPGGRVYLRFPGGVEASGEVLAIEPPRRLVYTVGFTSGQPMPPGGSRVTIELEEIAAGTRLALRHEFAEAPARDHHVQGWRYQLAVFANLVADDGAAGAGDRVDAWFAAWSQPEAARRQELLREAVTADIRFRDRYSLVEGLGDLEPHLAAVHAFMPGSRLERVGEVRHCQGTVLAEWIAFGPQGEIGRGANVFTLAPDGRIADVVGLWGPPAG
jgi:uncharacterized protein YndB with AHSA1/START domain